MKLTHSQIPLFIVSILFVSFVGTLIFFSVTDTQLKFGDFNVLAFVTGESQLGEVTDGETYDLSIHFCNTGPTPFTNLNFRAEVYGPDASSMPCKDEPISSIVSPSSGSGFKLATGKCADYDISIDTSLSAYSAGNDYNMIIYVYEGTKRITSIDNSADDINHYDECYAKYHYELTKSSNHCGTDEAGDYYFCKGVAWQFDIAESETTGDCGNDECDEGETHSSCPADCEELCGNTECDEGEDATSCPTDCVACADGQIELDGACYDKDCTEDTAKTCIDTTKLGYTPCSAVGLYDEPVYEICEGATVCKDSACISEVCGNANELKDSTCADGTIIKDKFKCVDGKWEDNNKAVNCETPEKSTPESSTSKQKSWLAPVILLGILGGIALIFYGYKKGWWQKAWYQIKSSLRFKK